jgi:transcriptional regulator with GAF, ATPase, and Fis domain
VPRGRSSEAVYELADDRRLVIGADPDADLRLADDPLVAPLQAEIRFEDGQWILVRCTIRNNLKLNGHRVESPLPLRSGDQITVGGTKLLFEDTSEGNGSERSALESCRDLGSDADSWIPSGDSGVIRVFVETLRRFAASDESVLLSGETGSGKEVAARAIHQFSARRKHPFVVVNCPALPSSLVEAELFGIDRGVATGVDARKGLLESADPGTLFLDEVGDLEPMAQAKLLRFLQERTLSRVGGRSRIRLDVRIIAATHHDIEADVAAGRFRLDLHHRLKVLTLRVPSLRERPEDIPVLLEEFRTRARAHELRFCPEALRLLQSYEWPGNIRELKHLVRSLDVVVEGDEILLEHIPAEIRCRVSAQRGTLYRAVVEEAGCFWELVQKPFLRRQLSREEVRCFILRAYEEAGNSYLGLARLLHIEHDYKKMLDFLGRHRLGVERPAKAARQASPQRLMSVAAQRTM